MVAKLGETFRNLLNGGEYIVKRIVNRMVVLESQNGKHQILTEVKTLEEKILYQRKEEATS